jgi:hypothetical protein
MKRAALTLVLLAATVVPVVAQKIDTETTDRTRIVHLKTALNHLTVIEASEPVVQVAAGSPSFKVEWRENKVFVQPTEADAATNLFIWTATQRLNYELEPAGAVAEMDFAVDQAPVHVPEPVKPVSQAPAQPSISDLLLATRPVRMQPSKQQASKPVDVWISDLYEKDGVLLIRYAVHNRGTQPYSLSTPRVFRLDDARLPESLYPLVNSQLGDEQVSKLKINQQTPVRILDAQAPSSQVAPGQGAVGVVSLQLAASSQPTVLRLQFPDAGQANDPRPRRQSEIAAFVVR